GTIGRAREQHGSVVGALGNDDDSMQAHAVAHGNHDVALDVVEAGGGGPQLRRSLAGEVGIFGRFLSGADGDNKKNTEAAECFSQGAGLLWNQVNGGVYAEDTTSGKRAVVVPPVTHARLFENVFFGNTEVRCFRSAVIYGG